MIRLNNGDPSSKLKYEYIIDSEEYTKVISREPLWSYKSLSGKKFKKR